MVEEKNKKGPTSQSTTIERSPYFPPEVISEQEIVQDVLVSESK